MVLLGPPGTAKSMLAEAMVALVGGRLFRTLLTRFSTPEDVFGPLSLPALEAGRYERLTEGYLPEAEVAFIDEIYKANASILNALLGILLERRFHQGSQVVEVPLRSLVAASNELPDDDDQLEALDDRLLLRVEVGPIADDRAFLTLLQDGLKAPDQGAPAPLSTADLQAIEARAAKVELPEAVALRLMELRRGARREGLRVSDRRFRQVAGLLRVMAAAEGRTSVEPSDLGVLRLVLWRRPEEQERARTLLSVALEDLAGAPTGAPPVQSLLEMVTELSAQADALARSPADCFSDAGRGRLEELTHKVEEVGGHAARWGEHQRAALAAAGSLWMPFWSDVADGGLLRQRMEALLDHALFVRVLPNVDGALARRCREQGAAIRARLGATS